MPKEKNPLFGGGEPSAQELQLYAAQDMMPQLFKKYPKWALENEYTTIAAPRKKKGLFSRLFGSDELSESQKREAEGMAAAILAAETPSVDLDQEARKAAEPAESPRTAGILNEDGSFSVMQETPPEDNQKTTHATTQASSTSKFMADNPEAAEDVGDTAGEGEIVEAEDAVTGPSNVVDISSAKATNTGSRKDAGEKESVNTPGGKVAYWSSYMATLFDDFQSFYTLIGVERFRFNEEGEPVAILNIAGIVYRPLGSEMRSGTLNPHGFPEFLLGKKQDIKPAQGTLGSILKMAGVNSKYRDKTIMQATTRDEFLNKGSGRSRFVRGTVTEITKSLVSIMAYAVLRKNTPLYVAPGKGKGGNRGNTPLLDGPPSYKDFADNGGTRPSAIWPRERILEDKKGQATMWQKGLMSEYTVQASKDSSDSFKDRRMAYVTNASKFANLTVREYFSKMGPMMGTSNSVPFLKTQEMTPEELIEMAEDPNFTEFYKRTALTTKGAGTFYMGKTGLTGGYVMRYVEGDAVGLEQKWDSPVLYSLNSGFINMMLLAESLRSYKVEKRVSEKVNSLFKIARIMIKSSTGSESLSDAEGKPWLIPDSEALEMMIDPGMDLTKIVLPQQEAERVLGSQVYKVVEKPKRLPFINPMLLDLHAVLSRVSDAQKIELYREDGRALKDAYGVTGNWRLMKTRGLSGMSQLVDEAAQYWQGDEIPGQIDVMRKEDNQIARTAKNQFVQPDSKTSAMMDLLGEEFFGGAKCSDPAGKCKFILVPFFKDGKAVDYFLALYIAKHNPKSKSSLSTRPHIILRPTDSVNLLPRVMGTGSQRIHFARKQVGEENYPLFFSDLFTLVAEARSTTQRFQPGALGSWSDGDTPLGALADYIENPKSLALRRERVASYNRMLGMSEVEAEAISEKAKQATQDAEERSSAGDKARQATQDAEERSDGVSSGFKESDYNFNPRPRRRRIRKIRR